MKVGFNRARPRDHRKQRSWSTRGSELRLDKQNHEADSFWIEAEVRNVVVGHGAGMIRLVDSEQERGPDGRIQITQVILECSRLGETGKAE